MVKGPPARSPPNRSRLRAFCAKLKRALKFVKRRKSRVRKTRNVDRHVACPAKNRFADRSTYINIQSKIAIKLLERRNKLPNKIHGTARETRLCSDGCVVWQFPGTRNLRNIKRHGSRLAREAEFAPAVVCPKLSADRARPARSDQMLLAPFSASDHFANPASARSRRAFKSPIVPSASSLALSIPDVPALIPRSLNNFLDPDSQTELWQTLCRTTEWSRRSFQDFSTPAGKRCIPTRTSPGP